MARTFVDGKVHVRRIRCGSCIFGSNSPVDDARRDQMVRDADAAESCIPCHSHLYQGEPVEPVCRGYFDRGSSMALRLAVVTGVVEFVEGRSG